MTRRNVYFLSHHNFQVMLRHINQKSIQGKLLLTAGLGESL